MVINMTKRAQTKRNKNGKALRNNAAAKSGLNKAILNSAWGKTKLYTEYKAKRLGKLVLDINPALTSQACNHCGYTHPDNRKTQSDFVCKSCGHSDNADINAAKNIRNKGVKQLLSGDIVTKKVKRCKITKSKVGRETSEPSQDHIKTQKLVEKVLGEYGITPCSLRSSLK
jgi:putative transposase